MLVLPPWHSRTQEGGGLFFKKQPSPWDNRCVKCHKWVIQSLFRCKSPMNTQLEPHLLSVERLHGNIRSQMRVLVRRRQHLRLWFDCFSSLGTVRVWCWLKLSPQSVSSLKQCMNKTNILGRTTLESKKRLDLLISWEIIHIPTDRLFLYTRYKIYLACGGCCLPAKTKGSQQSLRICL